MMSVAATQLTRVPGLKWVQTQHIPGSPDDSCHVVTHSANLVQIACVQRAGDHHPNTARLTLSVILRFGCQVVTCYLSLADGETVCYVLTSSGQLFAVPITDNSLHSTDWTELEPAADQLVMTSGEGVIDFIVLSSSIIIIIRRDKAITLSVHERRPWPDMNQHPRPAVYTCSLPVGPVSGPGLSDECLYCVYPASMDGFNYEGLVLERTLFAHLFGEEAYLLRTPVVLVSQPGGYILWMPLKPLQTTGEPQCRVLVDLADRPVGLHGFFLRGGEEPHVEYPSRPQTANCLVVVGHSGKLAMYKTDTEHHVAYSEHSVLGSVDCTTQYASNLIYSTGCQLSSLNLLSLNMLNTNDNRPEQAVKQAGFANAHFLTTWPSGFSAAVGGAGSNLHHVMLAVTSTSCLYLLHINWTDASPQVSATPGPSAIKDALNSIQNTSKLLQTTQETLSEQEYCLTQLGLASSIAKATRNMEANSKLNTKAPVTAKVNISSSLVTEGLYTISVLLSNKSSVVMKGWNLAVIVSSRLDIDSMPSSDQTDSSHHSPASKHCEPVKNMVSYIDELMPGKSLVVNHSVEVTDLIRVCPITVSLCLVLPKASDNVLATGFSDINDGSVSCATVSVPLPQHKFGVLFFMTPDSEGPRLVRQQLSTLKDDLVKLQQQRPGTDIPCNKKRSLQEHTASVKLSRAEAEKLCKFLCELITKWRSATQGAVGDDPVVTGRRLCLSGPQGLGVSLLLSPGGSAGSQLIIQTSSPPLLLLTWSHIMEIVHKTGSGGMIDGSTKPDVRLLKHIKSRLQELEEQVFVKDRDVTPELFQLYLQLRQIAV